MKTKRIFINLFFVNIYLFCLFFSWYTPLLSTYRGAFTNFTKANAQGSSWGRILNENTPFYADDACTILKFYLPYTYFVKIVATGEDSTRVIYMDDNLNVPLREGYIKTCDLYLFDGLPYSPYPEISLKITADEILFADSKKQYPKAVLSQGDTAFYYGEIRIDNENFCYVYSKGYIGYVRKNAFATFEIPAHEIPLVTEEPEIPNESIITSAPLDNDTNPTSIDATMKIVIIIAVAVTCLSVIYLLFKPNAKQTRLAVYSDDEDY